MDLIPAAASVAMLSSAFIVLHHVKHVMRLLVAYSIVMQGSKLVLALGVTTLHYRQPSVKSSDIAIIYLLRL